MPRRAVPLEERRLRLDDRGHPRERLDGGHRELLQAEDAVGQAPVVEQPGVRVDADAEPAAAGDRLAGPAAERHRALPPWCCRGPGSSAALDPRRPQAAAVDEPGVGLQQRGAGVQPLAGVVGGGDAADGDDRPGRARPAGAAAAAPRWPAALSGAPESPPAPARSTCSGRDRSPARLMVVLVATIPSRPSSSARSATSSRSLSARSGAIFTSSGRCRSVTASARRRTASSSGRSRAVACRSRSPGVFGELTLTTR